jgi:hypothetical protein
VTGRVVRVSVWALLLVVLGISVLVVALAPLRSPWADTPDRLADLLQAGTAIPFAWFGAIILTRRPGNRIGALLLLTGLATAVVGVGAIGTRYALMDQSDAWVFPWIDSWSFVLLAGALFSLLLLFPTGKPVSPRWRPVLWALVAWTTLSGLVAALAPVIETEQGPEFDNPIGVPALAVAGLYMLPWLWFLLFPVLMFASGISLAIATAARVAWSVSSSSGSLWQWLSIYCRGWRGSRQGIGAGSTLSLRRQAGGCQSLSGWRCCDIGCTTLTGSSIAPWSTACSPPCLVVCTPGRCWSSGSCSVALAPSHRAGPSPARPWLWPPPSSRPAVASKRRWIAASTDTVTTLPKPSRRSVAGYVINSTSTRSRPICSP